MKQCMSSFVQECGLFFTPWVLLMFSPVIWIESGFLWWLLTILILFVYPAILLPIYACFYINRSQTDYELSFREDYKYGDGEKYESWNEAMNQFHKDKMYRPLDRMAKQEIVMLLLACMFYPVPVAIWIGKLANDTFNTLMEPFRNIINRFK